VHLEIREHRPAVAVDAADPLEAALEFADGADISGAQSARKDCEGQDKVAADPDCGA